MICEFGFAEKVKQKDVRMIVGANRSTNGTDC